jgi:hypothetical protein
MQLYINFPNVISLFKASHTNTPDGSTHPSTDSLQINFENLVASDEYSARQMKLLNERKDMLDRKLYETPDNISSSGLTSPMPPSSSVSHDRYTDLMNHNGNFSVDNYRTYRSEDSVRGQIAESMEKESEDSNTYPKEVGGSHFMKMEARV